MARHFVDVRPLKESRDFRLLISGQLASMIGSQLTLVAIPLQVFHSTNSNLWVGLVSLVQLPPLILGSLWGGAVGDRSDRRLILVVTSIVLSAMSAGLALDTLIGHANLAVLVVLSAVAAGVTGFANPARNAAIPQLVKPEQLIGAYSLNQVVFQVSIIAGPSVGGVLIAAFGFASCYWIDTVTFLLLMVATMTMSPLRAAEGPRTTIRRSVIDGFTYVRSHIAAQCVYLVDLNAMIFGMPTALFPYIAIHWYHGGSVTAGFLYAAPGAGAVFFAVTTGWLERLRQRGRAVVLAVMAWGGAITLFGFTRTAWVGIVLLALAGGADVISAVLRNTILQSTITNEFRGRLSAIQMAVVTGGPRLGNFEAGAVAGLTTAGFSVISGGIACIVGAAALVGWRPQFWRDATDV